MSVWRKMFDPSHPWWFFGSAALAGTALFAVVVALTPRRAPPSACWDTADVLGAYAQCRRSGVEHDRCVCYARELQRVSPDPETRSTVEEQLKAADACHIEATAGEAASSEGMSL